MDIYTQVSSSSTKEALKRPGNEFGEGVLRPRCRTFLECGHERGPSRRAERASDLGGDTGNRTPDLLLAKQALYQLSYVPEVHPVVLDQSKRSLR